MRRLRNGGAVLVNARFEFAVLNQKRGQLCPRARIGGVALQDALGSFYFPIAILIRSFALENSGDCPQHEPESEKGEDERNHGDGAGSLLNSQHHNYNRSVL